MAQFLREAIKVRWSILTASVLVGLISVLIGSVLVLVTELGHDYLDTTISSSLKAKVQSSSSAAAKARGTDTEDHYSKLLHLTREYFAQRASDSREAEVSLPDTTPPPLTEEEYERLSKLARVEHIYWSKGRVILDAMLSEESRNQEWEDSVTQSARAMLEREEFQGTELKNVACGSTLCKIEFHHENKEAFRRFDSSGGMDNPDWLGHDFGVIKRLGDEADSAMETTVFFAQDNSPYDVMVDRLINILEQEAA
jgi:hypothetical protein